MEGDYIAEETLQHVMPYNEQAINGAPGVPARPHRDWTGETPVAPAQIRH